MSNLLPSKIITATDIYRYFQCPHWSYYERFATSDEKKYLRRSLSEGEKQRMEHGLLHELDVVHALFGDGFTEVYWKNITTEQAFDQTLSFMKQGVDRIYQGVLFHGNWIGRPDILERRKGDSLFGPWYYAPVDVKSSRGLEKYQKMQLLFYSFLLERIQGRFPAHPEIINIDKERISFAVDDMIEEFTRVINDLEKISSGIKPDPVLRKNCFDTSPWGKACQQYAESKNDIALLYNVDVTKLRLLRDLGLKTVHDIAEMDPQTFDGAAKGLRLHGLETMKRQAQSLQSGVVIIREPVIFSRPVLEIHFDIESDPPNDFDYLYGLLLRKNGKDQYLPFVAESKEKEGEMWDAFLSWLETLPEDYVVYHYSVYELTRLAVLEKRYGGNTALEHFRSSMVDLKELISSSCTFPLYFYGLKYIAKFLSFHWRGDVQGGGQSVDVFEEFTRTGDRSLLESIIIYNEDDVRATAHLKDWLMKYGMEVNSYSIPYPWVGNR
ncbi:TM0106 family RecB-like putative nuclease [Candidatus Uhrbacteria bacterium]|nr:TM0106 family RecB-like putative nuclease [Candidatus Uhrbacteria bacterium]